MALKTIMDVAEMHDLGFRVVAPEACEHVEREALRPSRVFGIWGGALVTIAVLGLAGRLFEPAPAAPAAVPSLPRPPAIGTVVGWPSNGHSAFRYPARGATVLTLHSEFVLGPDSSTTRLAVGGRIDGPVGNVAVQLVSGSETFGEVTRYYAPIGGRPPAPYGAFDLSFDIPSDAELSDLWIVARAYLNDRVVAVLSEPVAPSWPQVGPDKYVIDDVIAPTATWSQPKDGVVYPVRKAARVQGLAWQVDPYAR